MLQYDSKKKELYVTEENEYIYDVNDECEPKNYFKRVSLANTDNWTHYLNVILEPEETSEEIEEEIVEEQPTTPKKLTDM